MNGYTEVKNWVIVFTGLTFAAIGVFIAFAGGESDTDRDVRHRRECSTALWQLGEIDRCIATEGCPDSYETTMRIARDHISADNTIKFYDCKARFPELFQ